MDPALFPHGMQFDLPSSKGGMFGNGKFGVGQAIVAALNGYLAGRGNPVGLANMQMMQQMGLRKQQRQQEIEDYNRKRGDENADFMSHYQYELDHPKPQQPTQTDRYIQEILDPNTDPKRREILQSVLMPPTLQMVNGNLVSVPRAPQSQPTEPVGKLRPLGAGGPASSAPGGFPY